MTGRYELNTDAALAWGPDQRATLVAARGVDHGGCVRMRCVRGRDANLHSTPWLKICW